MACIGLVLAAVSLLVGAQSREDPPQKVVEAGSAAGHAPLQSPHLIPVLPIAAIEDPARLLSEAQRAGKSLPSQRAFLLSAESAPRRDTANETDAGAMDAAAPFRALGAGLVGVRRGPVREGAETIVVDIGPAVLPPEHSRAAPAEAPSSEWWTRRRVELPVDMSHAQADAASADAAPSRDGASATPEDAEPAESLVRLLPAEPKVIARAIDSHQRALDALLAAKEAEYGAADLPKPSPPPALALKTDLFEVVAWIELADASQAALRQGGNWRAADLVVADMRAFLKSIRCPEVEWLLADRVPIGTQGFASLVLHPSWRSDAWHLVEPVARMAERLDRARREFDALAERMGREAGLVGSAVDELKARLAVVSANLPTGFEWTKDFQADCEAHMREAFARGATFGGAFRAPAFDAADPIVAGIYARTVAFEVFGYAWSRPDAMPPSMQQSRAEFISQALEPLRAAIRDRRFVDDLGVDQGQIAYGMLEQFLASREARWKPWIVFPTSAEIAAEAGSDIMMGVQFRFRDIVEDQRAGYSIERMNWDDACWQLDAAFAMRGNARSNRSGRRPWIFHDCALMFWDGYVPLRRW